LNQDREFRIFTVMKTEKDLQRRKREIRQLIDATEDDSLLEQVYAILNGPSEGWWDEEAEREAIEAADADIAAGRVFTHEQVLENIKACLKK
jgi:predicted transcriptional regulator